MKKLFVVFLFLMLTSCADSQYINGEEVSTFGLCDQELRKEGVMYKVSPESVIWSIIFCETIVVPIWLIGWHLWEPYPPKN